MNFETRSDLLERR
ncbi:hypothetical protein Zm00014a_008493 [Zea mays]|uniref:Uncharacterized protein n=1 Tax=Zea mays TaxID=4577 RepID=A0A3L6D7E2_MAIZE|nr:hypothetical protein Zm00014a_008493 [Zea mays]